MLSASGERCLAGTVLDERRHPSFERLRNTYSRDGLIPKKGVENSYKVLLAHNAAVRRAPVVWINQTYTNAFVEKALQKFR